MKIAPSDGYEDWYVVRTHEIDFRKQLTFPSLMMLMQEASMHNALELKVSIWDTEMNQLSWVLLRKEVTVLRRPVLGEKIKIVTYPAGFERVFAYRDFWVYDEDMNKIAHAASTWTLINLDNRKLSKIPEFMFKIKLPIVDQRLPIPQTRIVQPENYKESYNYKIRHYDLDWNHHVNNIVLTKLMLQAIEEKTYSDKKLTNFTIHIKTECYFDECVTISLAQENSHIFHHQIKGEDGRTVALALSSWV